VERHDLTIMPQKAVPRIPEYYPKSNCRNDAKWGTRARNQNNYRLKTESQSLGKLSSRCAGIRAGSKAMSGRTGTCAASAAALCAVAVVLGGPAGATNDARPTGTVPIVTVPTPPTPPAVQPETRASPAATATPAKKRAKIKRKPRKIAKPAASDRPPLPPGPLQVVVSLDNQTATLFANGIAVAQSPISSGTRTHPTPLGVFSVIQKRRHHVSNIYGAKMPFMQRLTWSGTALHEGPLPGYPASHGCVRMTRDFSELLWDATKIGTRVIIARPDVAPVEIDHPALFRPAPATVPLPPEAPTASLTPTARDSEARVAEPRVVRTADVSSRLPRAVLEDSARPMVAAPLSNTPAPEQATKLRLEASGDGTDMVRLQVPVPAPSAADQTSADDAAPAQQAAKSSVQEPIQDRAGTVRTGSEPPQRADIPTAIPAAPTTSTAAGPTEIPADPIPTLDPKAIADEAAARAREARRNAGPVTVFVSRRDSKLYVRQAMTPLFDMPVTISNPERPIGTHVYTAMEAKDDGLRWTVVSIPSSYPRAEEPARPAAKAKRRSNRPVKAAPVDLGPPSDAGDALNRVVIPPEAAARIAQLVKPGSSLIVSDNRLSRETGKGTDLIVETP
jgi:lipoprotein-anchoring transpeptidase ErfK/SrfK